MRGGRYVLTLAIIWPKGGRALPSPRDLMEEIWRRLTAGGFKRVRRLSKPLFWPKAGPPRVQPSRFVNIRIRFKEWRGEVLIREEDVKLTKLLSSEEGREAAAVCLQTALGWAFRFFHGRWPREEDKFAWVYRAHRTTALLVAEEVANLYREKSPLLSPRQYLDEAHPILEKRIKEAYLHPTVTSRRLALALVDIKFEQLLPRLLDPNRMVGLDDAKLWNMFLPPENRERLTKLRPAPSVREIMSWPESKREVDEVASGFSNWWCRIVYDPLRPLYPPSDVPIHERKTIAFLEQPGVERWASIVWEALNS